jgi:Skp family chaperone for outer membrane proteins
MMRAADRALMVGVLAGVGLAAGVVAWRGVEPTATATGLAEDRMIATVDVISLLEDGLQQDAVNTEREALRTALFTRLEGLQADLQSQAEILQATPQDDPQYNVLVQQFQQGQAQLQQASQEAGVEFESLSARQAAETYARVHAAAKSVAQREGFKYIIASRGDASLGVVQNLTNVTQQVLARPVMHGGTDITDLVFKELGFVEPTPPPAFPDDAGAAPGGEPGAAPGAAPGGEPGAAPGGQPGAGTTTSSPQAAPTSDGGMKPLNPAPTP